MKDAQGQEPCASFILLKHCSLAVPDGAIAAGSVAVVLIVEVVVELILVLVVHFRFP